MQIAHTNIGVLLGRGCDLWSKKSIERSTGVLTVIEPVHALANQLNMLAPVGIAIHEVPAV